MSSGSSDSGFVIKRNTEGKHDDEALGPGMGDRGIAKVFVNIAGGVEPDETELLALSKSRVWVQRLVHHAPLNNHLERTFPMPQARCSGQ